MPTKKVTLNVTSDEKPSLASLKLDKKKTATAQKRAVKKIEAGVSKKVPTRVVKKPGENKVAIHRVKKAPKKEVVSQAKAQKSREVLKVVDEPTKKLSDYITLPSNISIRAREKALVILQSVQEDFKEPAQRIAYVSGLCFILLGATLALSFATTLPKDGQLTAQLSSTTISSTTKEIAALPVVREPVFKLQDQLPAELLTKTSHRMSISDTAHVDVRLFSLTSGTQIDVQVDDRSAEDFFFELDPATIKADRYVVKLFIEGKGGTKYVRRLGEIVVPKTESQEDQEDQAEEDLGDEIQPEEEETSATSTDESQPVEPQLSIKTLRTTLSGKTSISITSNVDPSKVTLFIRKLRSIQGKELGSAEKYGDTWYYFFDTLNEPNGEYEISARMLHGGAFIPSNTIKVKITNFSPETNNERVAQETGVNETYQAVPSPITESAPLRTPELEETEETSSTTIRTFSDFRVSELSDTAQETEQIVPEEKQQIDALAGLYQNELRELFKRYAVAVQTGDSLIIELAEKELLAGKDKIVTDVLNTQDINHTADNVDTLFTTRISEIKKRVDTFEELRRTASNSESSLDQDQDGIADFDEIHLYLTDPKAGDSDNDGVTDGVEIMRGFNPLNASAEAVIKYELPQETVALVHDDVLSIETVSPVIRSDISEEAPEVQASIKGTALPNSYVTLYVFSTPMIVTVRTDQDGSFEYTFEKELEDGEHEVYVAVTDNTGAIVAKSNPFKFIKEAQAFTPVDDAESNTQAVTTLTNPNTFSLYNAVIGLAILALGLILLMLGITMREKEAHLAATAHDLKPS